VTTLVPEQPTRIVEGSSDAAVDDALIQTVRLMCVGPGTVTSAATQLREHVHDEAVLRRARNRVSQALSERPSAEAAHAAAILEEALSLGRVGILDIDHVASCGWPFDTPCPHCYPTFHSRPTSNSSEVTNTKNLGKVQIRQ
jgi:hypothetical protein